MLKAAFFGSPGELFYESEFINTRFYRIARYIAAKDRVSMCQRMGQ